MNPLSLAEYELILRRDYTSFIERSFYDLNPDTRLVSGSYIEVMASKLEACRLGKIKRLIVNLPPRHLKSHCASIALPAWWFGHHPSAQIICASYGQDLADKLARDCRTIMQTPWYEKLFPTRLSERQAVNDFGTTDQGFRMATSVEGVLTGRGGDLIVIDDPLKPDEAFSEQRRTKVNQWFDNTLLSRLNDKNTGCIIIVMQRLHQNDLVGHVLEHSDWEVLSFPAIAVENEKHQIESPLGRRVFSRREGDILQSERESRQTLDALRRTLGEYTFESQYQQNPTPVGGAMVKTEWLRYYEADNPPKGFLRIVMSWDTANKATELNDYSACTVWGQLGKNFYLLEVVRLRLNYPDLKRKVLSLAERYVGAKILIEDKASGTQLIQELSHEIYGVQAYEPPTGMDKVMRLHSQTDLFENGFVWLPNRASWLAEYIRELTSFPGSKYDDQVDSTAQALHYMRESNGLAIWARLGEM